VIGDLVKRTGSIMDAVRLIGASFDSFDPETKIKLRLEMRASMRQNQAEKLLRKVDGDLIQ
jgi:hypothetical protein